LFPSILKAGAILAYLNWSAVILEATSSDNLRMIEAWVGKKGI
jgi:hypothetical protein